jgi:hypothetical protein
MKKVLVLALIAVFVLGMTSCGKKKEEEGKTKTELLCIEKGWKLTSAVVNPGVTVGGEITTNYMDYLYDWEKNIVLVFSSDHGELIKVTTPAPEDQDGYLQNVMTTWNFSSDESQLKFQFPFFYDRSAGHPYRTFDSDLETATITTLDETKLTLTMTIDQTETKGTITTYVLNYEPVKK